VLRRQKVSTQTCGASTPMGQFSLWNDQYVIVSTGLNSLSYLTQSQ